MTASFAEWQYGALRTVLVDGELLAVRLLSSSRGVTALDLQHPATGREIAIEPVWDEYRCIDADSHLCTVGTRDGTYVLLRGRGSSYTVQRVTSSGFEYVGSFPAGPVQGVHGIIPAVVGGDPAVVTTDWQQVRYRELLSGVELREPWAPPAGWQVDELVSAGGRAYAWLEPVPPPGPATPASTDWRGWLWDVLTGTPVGRPVLLRGYRWGPWPLGDRPALLVKIDWRTYQVWDLARNAPVGPDLPADTPDVLTAVSFGTLHGRPVLAGGADRAAWVWDLGTSEVIHAETLPGAVITTAFGPTNQLYLVDGSGALHERPIGARAVHPLTRR